MMEEKRPSQDEETNSAGKPGGSALVDSKKTYRPVPQEERASRAIIEATKDLPVPTRDPGGDPTNMILDRKTADRKAATEPTAKKD
jgi:hypothetical protein